MSTTTSVAERIRGLVQGLVDDAAVFPPGDATVTDALDAHRHHRRAWYADLVGPLLVRASQATELLEQARPGDDLRVGLVADSGLAGLVAAAHLFLDLDDRAALAQVEIALPVGHEPEAATRVLIDQLALSATAYVEVPRTGFEPALDVLAEDGAERAKYRTGGAVAAAFPTEAELAAFLHATVARGLTAKLTAGLHGALRSTSPERFELHGFLNTLAAVAAARDGASPDDLAALLAARTPAPVLAVLASADTAGVRRSLASFGCCGVTDPVDDLVALGLLAAER